MCMRELSLLDKRPSNDRRVTRQLVWQMTPPCTLLPAPPAQRIREGQHIALSAWTAEKGTVCCLKHIYEIFLDRLR